MNQNIDNKNEIFKHRFREGNDDELILLISEKDQKAYLPYHYSDLKEIMDKNPDKYHNVQQVIENEENLYRRFNGAAFCGLCIRTDDGRSHRTLQHGGYNVEHR